MLIAIFVILSAASAISIVLVAGSVIRISASSSSRLSRMVS
ncbi:hypothetical protein AB0G73_27895 [Streptomyces sp. NPDC020719]